MVLIKAVLASSSRKRLSSMRSIIQERMVPEGSIPFVDITVRSLHLDPGSSLVSQDRL